MANEEGAGSGGGSKLGTALSGVNTLLLAGLLALQFLKPAAAPPAPHAEGAEGAEHAAAAESGHGEAKAEKPEGGHGGGEGGGAAAIHLSDIAIRLRDPEVDRYVKMTLDLELASDADKDPVNKRMPQMREAILTYFSDLTIGDVRGSEALARIKHDLLERLNQAVPGKRIKGIYVSDFVAQ